MKEDKLADIISREDQLRIAGVNSTKTKDEIQEQVNAIDKKIKVKQIELDSIELNCEKNQKIRECSKESMQINLRSLKR